MSTLIVSALVSFFLALISGAIVERVLTDRVSIVGYIIGLERVENAGIAFGIGIPPWLLAVLIPTVLVFIGFAAYRARGSFIHSIGYGLIIGGALANIVDRLQDGFVTDFIQIGWWPVFNVADSCITVGVILLLLAEKAKGKRQK